MESWRRYWLKNTNSRTSIWRRHTNRCQQRWKRGFKVIKINSSTKRKLEWKLSYWVRKLSFKRRKLGVTLKPLMKFTKRSTKLWLRNSRLSRGLSFKKLLINLKTHFKIKFLRWRTCNSTLWLKKSRNCRSNSLRMSNF